jgi:DNA-binding transcriptional ArsR family regulator
MQSAVTLGAERGVGRSRGSVDPVAVFDVLANDGCRAVITAIGHETLTAAEIRDRVDAPMSSIYRHLDALTETRLLEESVRINTHGRNQNQYARIVPGISISLADDFAVQFD